MKIALYGKKIDSTHAAKIQILFEQLQQKNISFLVHTHLQKSISKHELAVSEDLSYFNSYKDLKEQKISFLLSIGGD